MFSVPLIFIIPFAPIFWTAYVWAFYVSEWQVIKKTYADSLQANVQNYDTRESPKYLMFLSQVVAFVVAFIEPLRFDVLISNALFWIGVVVLIGASLLRRHCFRMLGEYFTLDVQVEKEQLVIERGAYSLVRHPSYTAGILMYIGVGISLASWASLLTLFIAAIYVYRKRIAVEERMLEEMLGVRYREYMKNKKRLIPYVY